jgi:hypothetical protein
MVPPVGKMTDRAILKEKVRGSELGDMNTNGTFNVPQFTCQR